MRIVLLAVALLTIDVAPLLANCYVLQNNTDSPQTWHFQYSNPLPGAKTQLRLAAHAQFPANRAWCWDTPSDYYATTAVDPGAYTPSWQGALVLGNGSNAAPSGTYSLQPVKTTSIAQPQQPEVRIAVVER